MDLFHPTAIAAVDRKRTATVVGKTKIQRLDLNLQNTDVSLQAGRKGKDEGAVVAVMIAVSPRRIRPLPRLLLDHPPDQKVTVKAATAVLSAKKIGNGKRRREKDLEALADQKRRARRGTTVIERRSLRKIVRRTRREVTRKRRRKEVETSKKMKKRSGGVS